MKTVLVLGLLLFLSVLQPGQSCMRTPRLLSCLFYEDGTCKSCPDGSFKTLNENACKPCRNCEKEGKKELRSCTKWADAVCFEGCGRGQFFDHYTGSCQSCPVGTYMPKERHDSWRCKNCSVPDFSKHEVALRECSAMNDAIIRCKPGYFRQNDKCIACRQCGRRGEKRFVVRPCSEATDTVCGNECGPGQFLDRSQSACVPCPENTFMVEEKHHNLECQFCTVPIPYSAERLEWKCNKTHDSIIMCSYDHFRTRGGDGCECVHCRDCGQRKMIRPCGKTTDTVCEGIKPRRVRKGHRHC